MSDDIVFDMSTLSNKQQDANADWIKPRHQKNGGKERVAKEKEKKDAS